MSDINAAIGRVQLKRFKELSKKRKSLSRYYEKLLLKNDKFKIIKRDFNKEVPHIFCVVINNLKKRGLFVKELARQNIQLGTHYYPGYKLKYYKKDKKFFPNTERIFDKVITLPLHPDLNFKKIKLIVKKITNTLNKKKYC